jgi:alkylglycerol monooxygenase
MADPILYATPVFALALGAEGLALRGTRRAYTFRRLGSALGCLAWDQVVNLATLAVFLGAYAAVHHASASVLGIAHGPVAILLAIVLHDLAYYAYHRASHRVNVLWAVHVVHHQSDHYDFTVSLRQGAVATWVTYLFYLPLALVVPAETFVLVHAAYQIYQFFVHTELVRRIGPLEWLLASPSHHRVHHGQNAPYVDKNYGGFFIVFDRLLGTFEPESVPVSYGVPGGYARTSPLFANTYLFVRLIAASRRVRGFGGLLRLWFGPPESSPLTGAARAGEARASRGLGRWTLGAGLALALVAVVAGGGLAIGLRIALGIVALALIEAGSKLLDAPA